MSALAAQNLPTFYRTPWGRSSPSPQATSNITPGRQTTTHTERRGARLLHQRSRHRSSWRGGEGELDGPGRRLLGGGEAITFDEALAVAALPDADVPALIALAHRVRLQRAGPGVELESILSAKTGACSEDCGFCSQSRHWRSTLQPEPFIDLD